MVTRLNFSGLDVWFQLLRACIMKGSVSIPKLYHLISECRAISFLQRVWDIFFLPFYDFTDLFSSFQMLYGYIFYTKVKLKVYRILAISVLFKKNESSFWNKNREQYFITISTNGIINIIYCSCSLLSQRNIRKNYSFNSLCTEGKSEYCSCVVF